MTVWRRCEIRQKLQSRGNLSAETAEAGRQWRESASEAFEEGGEFGAQIIIFGTGGLYGVGVTVGT